MKRSSLLLGLLFMVIITWAQPRPVKLSSNIVIDSDCGFDDLRAISLLLSAPGVTVRAIITSDGCLPPAEGIEKVNSLLREFGKDNIPTGCGNDIKGVNPSWREFNRNISWGSHREGYKNSLKASDCLVNALKNENGKTTIACLGPLTNIEDAVKAEPAIISRIDRIVWYNESVKPPRGFNYECDRQSADLLLKSNIRVDVISNLNRENASFDTSLVTLCSSSGSNLARILNKVFIQPDVSRSLHAGHLRLGDDLVALYITDPDLFSVNASMEKLNLRFNVDYNLPEIKEAIGDMIKGAYVPERNIVFNRFPLQREQFNYDVRSIMDTTIALYGPDEWKANVMTDEFHGHLGVFSIVGAKMGIRAREIFGAGPDMIEVTTFAGTKPPYSCLNDGIQVSTGATLGMGTIHIAKKGKASPSAIFTYNKRSVKISLRKEYLDKVDDDIKKGLSTFGLMDDGYWKLIRASALRYWVEWDRNKIFDVEELNSKK